jgi:formylglycine-generating enzyme required for sulfatase activity
LQETVGYQGRPREFAELVSLLDKNLRLITPVDESQQTGTENHSYQLTHDYLVPSLREWLNQKQRETKKGRAELKLAERAATWGANRENKQLPTLVEWFQIRRLTDKSKWSKPESQVMIKANRFHGTRIGLLTSAVALLIASAISAKSWIDQLETERAQDALVTLLQSAEINRLPDELKKVSKLRPGIDAKLEKAIEATAGDTEERLKLNLALLDSSPKALDYVASKLSDAEAKQVPMLVPALQPYADQLKDKYWSIAEEKNAKSLLPVASALALWDPASDRWTGVSSSVVDQLVKENPLRLATWIETLRPAKAQLVTRLQQIVLNRGGSASRTEKDLALDMLDSYAEDFETLHELIVLGEPKVFAKFFSRYQKFQKQALENLQQELAVKVPGFEPANEADPSRLVAIERQANAAVALLRLEDPKPVYEFLTVDRDPESLSQFIYRIRGREVSSSLLIKSFDELRALSAPDDATKRQQHYDRLYGMILGLGEYPLDQLPSAERDDLLNTLATMYAEHPSRTIHSAVGWLLRRWGQDESVRAVEEKELDYDATGAREWYVIQVDFNTLLKGPIKQEEGSIDLTAPIYFTMLVYPGGEFEMGDPGQQKRKNVPGPFAVSDREVTWRQFSAVDDDTHRKSWEKQFQQQIGGRGLHPDEPVFGVNWFEAVNYCRWLTESRMPGEKNQCYVKKDLSGSDFKDKGWLSFPSNTDGAWEWPMNPKRSGFRLLTEAEWEYVACGGMETRYSFGSSESLLAEYGWFTDNSAKWSHRTQQLRPSIAGVFDIHGNLGEWVDDWYTEGSLRVLRGGSWFAVAAHCRSAIRGRDDPSSRNHDYGFRLALSPSGIPQSPEADK